MKTIIIALILLFSIGTYAVSDYKKEWGYKSVSCQLDSIAQISVEKQGKTIKTAHKKEKAKVKSIFTDLDTDTPKMIYPDNTNLIKLKKTGDTY